MEKKLIGNFKKLKSTKFSPLIKSLYIFGSYAEGKSKCGDIDFLIIYNEFLLFSIIKSIQEETWSEFTLFNYKEYTLLGLENFFKSLIWAFRTCKEYPFCLRCNDELRCKYPEDTDDSVVVNFCFKNCRLRKKDPIPYCCLEKCCIFICNIEDPIFERVTNILKNGCPEYYEISPNFKVKIIEFIRKPNLYALKREFKMKKRKKELTLIKVL